METISRSPSGSHDQGVLVLPAPVFHHQGHFRISLTATDAMLDRALDVLTEICG